jgi:CubicO group peptidase (beta-lactamase class C family)
LFWRESLMLHLDFRIGLLALVLSPIGGQLALAASDPEQIGVTAAPSPAREIAEIEHGLDLPKLMKDHGVPGISVAVIHDFKIAWAKGYGVTEKGGTNAVTPRTLFMAGSISKPVAAMGALALVDRGTLSLDQDVNDRLVSWKIPASEYVAGSKVTLGLILDHTAGFSGGDFFPGYAVGENVPTLPQILGGQTPATTPPVRISRMPGAKWEYSGNGYLVAQQLMTDAAGKPFPALMDEQVFAPLDMKDTSFDQPIGADRAIRAASGTLANGTAVAGGWHVQPEMAAGGLWTTPTDLAKLALEIALSAHGKSHRVLSPSMANEMITPHWQGDVINILGTPASPDQMGYGFFVGQDHRFGHIGGNVGYQASLVMFADSGNGAVIMTNSDIGLQAGNALLNKIAAFYSWNYVAPPPP